MKRIIYLLLIIPLFMSCTNESKEELDKNNPFFSDYDTPFEVPPFDKINNSHYMPAFEKGMEIHKKEVEAILSNTEKPTFNNTIVALDESGKILSKVSRVFFGLASANTNPEMQMIQMEISPKLSAHSDEIRLDPRYFERVKSVYENREKFNLSDEDSFILENMYKGLVWNGA